MATVLSIKRMYQSVSLKREIIIKESDVNINYHSVEKKSIGFCRPKGQPAPDG